MCIPWPISQMVVRLRRGLISVLRDVDSGPSGATRYLRNTLHDLQSDTKEVRVVAYRLNNRG